MILLKLRHWQVFLLLFLILILANYTFENSEIITRVLNMLGIQLYFFWILGLGMTLTSVAEEKVIAKRLVFIVNAIILLATGFIVSVFFEEGYESNSFFGFLLGVYLLYAIIQFSSYPAKILKSIEIGEEARFSNYFGYFLMFIFWPFGIWLIQPKLNKLLL